MASYLDSTIRLCSKRMAVISFWRPARLRKRIAPRYEFKVTLGSKLLPQIMLSVQFHRFYYFLAIAKRWAT